MFIGIDYGGHPSNVSLSFMKIFGVEINTIMLSRRKITRLNKRCS